MEYASTPQGNLTSQCTQTRMIFMSQFKNTLLVSIILVFLFGCGERNADIKNSNSYSKDGVSFEYAGNWKVTEDVEGGGYRYIFVESPGAAISRIEIYPKEASFSLLEFVKLDIEQLKASMPKVFGLSEKDEIRVIKKPFEGKAYTGYEYKFNLSLLGVDVPHISEFYMFQSETEKAYISNQVAVEDLDKVKDGFMLIVKDFEVKEALTKLSN